MDTTCSDENLAGSPLSGASLEGAVISNKRYKAFGIEYTHLKTRDGGDLYLTDYGVRMMARLLPQRWYENSYYAKTGTRLPGTSAVYRVPTRPVNGKSIHIVVKFCRIGRDVNPLLVSRSSFITDDDYHSARWNGPFEEFGNLMELRRGVFGERRRFLTQLPLGVFVPPEICEEWQLGRSSDSFRISQVLMKKDSTLGDDDDPVELDISRQYILLYSWVKGVGLDELQRHGMLSGEECESLTRRVYFQDLIPNGFKVLDTKPAHIILRTNANGRLIRKKGEYAYALIDYELLRRTAEHERVYGFSRRRQYWCYIYERYVPVSAEGMPEGLKSMTIDEVPYVFGPTPNGGKLWVLGHNHRLFDFFLPERWRSRDRIRLSSSNEVYHSVTPDNVHLVYKRSRVGVMPHSNPLQEGVSPAVEAGYNSPFEEVHIAEYLRHNGVNTTHPRAVYRTGQKSIMAKYILDDRRYRQYLGMTTPEETPEKVLSDQHDYYVLWGCWRGIDPERGYLPGSQHWGLTTINQAVNDQIITTTEATMIMENAVARLRARNIQNVFIGRYDFLLSFNDDMKTLRKTDSGEYRIIIAVDAYQAYHWRLLDGIQYRAILEETESELKNLGYEMLNLVGDHLLLSVTPEGDFMHDKKGRIKRAISNFELMRKI
jgi:hypothetical protein